MQASIEALRSVQVSLVSEIIMIFLDMVQKIIEEGRQDGSIREDVIPTTQLLCL